MIDEIPHIDHRTSSGAISNVPWHIQGREKLSYTILNVIRFGHTKARIHSSMFETSLVPFNSMDNLHRIKFQQGIEFE